MNPYEVLGVDKNADDNTIKRAYYKLAKKYHPDKCKDPDCEIKFKEVNQAYCTLMDKTSDFNFNTDNDNFDFRELFSSVKKKFLTEAKLFTHFFKEKTTKKEKDPSLDIFVNVHIELIDIFNCITRKIKLNIKKKCKFCRGMGIILHDDNDFDTCIDCGGSKFVLQPEVFEIQTHLKKNVFFRRGHESANSCNGDVIFIIHPKYDKNLIGINENTEIFIVNNYDLLILLKKSDETQNELSLFNNTIKVNLFEKVNKNLGLKKECSNENGDIFIRFF